MCYLSDNIVIYSTIASIPQRNNDPLLKFRKKMREMVCLDEVLDTMGYP